MSDFEIALLESVDSTNDYLKAHREMRVDFTAVRTLCQTKGRGRFSRTWYMGPGLDLAFSFIFEPKITTDSIGVYSLACGIALRRAMLRVVGHDLDLKWPNDLYCRGRKIAGILCEALFEEKPRVIAGIGVNVNSRLFPDWLVGSATSIAIENDKECDPGELMLRILSECRTLLSALSVPLEPALIAEWSASCSSIGKRAIYNRGGRRSTGTIKSIDDAGRLVVTDHETGKDMTIMDEIIIDET